MRVDGGLNLLWVAPYPPRHGGTAPSLFQLTTALYRRGHDVRVLAGITPETREFDREFVQALGGIRLTRYEIPYFHYRHDELPFDVAHRERERSAIRRVLPRLIQDERPDVVVAGQEPFAWIVPEIAREHGVPCVLLLRGAPTWSLLDGSFPDSERRSWLREFARADRIVAVSRFFAEGLHGDGLPPVDAIQNHVDLDRFAQAPKDERHLAAGHHVRGRARVEIEHEQGRCIDRACERE